MSKIKPALTAEEWEWMSPRVMEIKEEDSIVEGDRWCEAEARRAEYITYLLEGGLGYRPGVTQGAAALLLHDQPFGFTWEDVEHHKRLAGECGNSDGFSIDLLSQMEILSAWHLSMADRIQALLPPQDQ